MFAIGCFDTKMVQIGHREYLLCDECEQILSRYERRFQKTWMAAIPSLFGQLKPMPPDRAVPVPVPDFDSFKLFHLSVFWRAAVTEHCKVGDITFGPYANAIGDMIRRGDPGGPGVFPIFGRLILDSEGANLPVVTPLGRSADRMDGCRCYVMSYAYCEWILLMAPRGHREMADMEEKCRDGRMFLLTTVPFAESKAYLLQRAIQRKFKK